MTSFDEKLLIQNIQLIVSEFSAMREEFESNKKMLHDLKHAHQNLTDQLSKKKKKSREFLSGTEVRQALGISYGKFIKLIETGVLEGRKDGKNWKIHKNQLQKYKTYLETI